MNFKDKTNNIFFLFITSLLNVKDNFQDIKNYKYIKALSYKLRKIINNLRRLFSGRVLEYRKNIRERTVLYKFIKSLASVRRRL